MATLSLTQHIIATINSVVRTIGSLTEADSITWGLDNSGETEVVFDRTYEIASAAVAQTIFQTTTIGGVAFPPGWDVLAIESNVAAVIQLVGGENETGETHMVFTLRANVPQFFTGGDVTQINNASQIDSTWNSSGSADVIDRVQYFQSSGGVAKVRVLAFSD